MPRAKQSREERLEKKRIAERLRLQRIKNDPDLKAQLQVKEREKYLKKKRTGKVIPVSQMTPNQQKIARKKSRESSKRHYMKKKMARLAVDAGRPIRCSTSDTEADINTHCDSLETPSISSATITDTNSPVRPQSCSSNTTPKRFTRSTFKLTERNILNQSEHHSEPSVTLSTSASTATVANSAVASLNLSSSNILRPKQINTSVFMQNEQDLLNQSENDSLDLDSVSIDSPKPASTKSDSSNVSSSPCRSPVRSKLTVEQSAKKRSPWKHLLRKYRYRSQKELQIKDRQIEKLKKQNERYRKQLKRLQVDKKNKSEFRSILHNERNINFNDKQVPKINFSNNQIKKTIEEFFEEDDNSRLCPGKKEYITKHKIRKQKRYLTETLLNLHKKFLQNNPNLKLSYSCFCKFRPFWIVVPNVNARETCLCKEHENMELTVMALRKNYLIVEKSAFEVLKSLCCDPWNVKCLTGKCKSCENRHLNYKEFDNSNETYYWIWKKNTKTYKSKNGEEKSTMQVVKEKVTARPKDIIEHFENIITPYMNHCANIVSQTNYIKNLKKSLKPEECIIHCDFSENYSTKYASEIQSMHYSRDPITLHTSVIYYMQNGKLCTQSFCTISECLRHDAVAVWEHLLPILNFIEETVPEVDSLYFISDSPSAQYRNRKMFYVMAKLHWYYVSLRRVVWNYTEAGHGKGAPDGVGGVLKRTADQIVARGNDIQNIESLVSYLKQNVSNVILKVVEESGILEKDLLIPVHLKEFRGTMSVHQVVWSSENRNILAMRRLSCGQDNCSLESIECTHGQHIGFYNLDDLQAGTENQDRIRATPKRTKKTKDTSLVKRTHRKDNVDAGHSSKNQLESFNITDSDSFWTEVPSIDERIITPTLTKNVIESLQGKPCEMEDDDDDDLKIFD